MRRWLLLALLAALVVAAPGTATDQRRIKSYCSKTGDVCYGVFETTDGRYRFQLTLAAKYFSRYRICLLPLGEKATCKSFPVKKIGAQCGGKVFWQGNFPVRGPRSYRVTWRRGAHRLGPPLTFFLPAP
jgi:hypothetical protein